MTAAFLIRFFLLLSVFACVFLGSQVLLRSTAEGRARSKAMNARLRIIQQGGGQEAAMTRLRKNDPARYAGIPGVSAAFQRKLGRSLLMASVPYALPTVLSLMAAAFGGMTVFVALLAKAAGYDLSTGVLIMILAVCGATTIAVPLLIINLFANRRRKRMQEQFPVALDIFVRALRSGHPVASAIELLTTEMEDPIGSEFGLVSDEVTYGADLTEALQAMAERWDIEDIRMFVVSLAVQTETGGNLAEILENLSQVIRARAAMYMKVRSLSSEGRMTGWLLTALPIFTFVVLFATSPSFYLDVAKDPIFMIGFPVMILWYIVGVVSIRNMVNLKV